MTALLCLLSLLQADPAPTIPPGTSAEFQATAYKAELFISEGKFNEAAALLERLPEAEVTYSWDDSNVPESLRPGFDLARQAAMDDWSKMATSITFKESKNAKVKISFQETLPAPADSVLPAGAVFFVSEDPTEPRVEAVIAVKRDTPPVTCDPRSVQNEVGYAIGTYLGLAKMPRPVGYMGRIDTLTRLEMRTLPTDAALAKRNIEFANTLREAVRKKVRLQPTRPEAFLDKTLLTAESVAQGEPMEFSLQVSNRGTAPLFLKSVVDCGCVQVNTPDKVDPGQTGLIQVVVDTTNVWGPFHKGFVVYTNDPLMPDKRVDIKTKVIPAYRLLKPGAQTAIVVEEAGAKQDVYLAVNPKKPFKVTGVKVQGVKAVADFEPWEGKMADPDMGEDALPRTGYKISFLASPTERDGRVPLTFTITTDSKDFPVIYESVYLQWGLIAMPDTLYFGEIPKKDTVAYFYVSRPGKAFKVTGVRTDSEFLKATCEPFKNGDFRVTVTLSGRAPSGSFDGKVTVMTDDPKKKTLEVPVKAIFK